MENVNGRVCLGLLITLITLKINQVVIAPLDQLHADLLLMLLILRSLLADQVFAQMQLVALLADKVLAH